MQQVGPLFVDAVNKLINFSRSADLSALQVQLHRMQADDSSTVRFKQLDEAVEEVQVHVRQLTEAVEMHSSDHAAVEVKVHELQACVSNALVVGKSNVLDVDGSEGTLAPALGCVLDGSASL